MYVCVHKSISHNILKFIFINTQNLYYNVTMFIIIDCARHIQSKYTYSIFHQYFFYFTMENRTREYSNDKYKWTFKFIFYFLLNMYFPFLHNII